jgi:hypothetical protein
VLGRHLVQDFPADYRYFSTQSFRFHGRVIPSHDHMLETYPGTDGIKTGYVEASGFNLVTSAVRDNVRLIGVVMGAARAGERDLHMAALLDQGFTTMDVPPVRRDTQVASRLPSFIATAHAAPLPAPRAPPAKWSVQIGAFATEAGASGRRRGAPHGRCRRGAHRAGHRTRQDRLACATHRAGPDGSARHLRRAGQAQAGLHAAAAGAGATRQPLSRRPSMRPGRGGRARPASAQPLRRIHGLRMLGRTRGNISGRPRLAADGAH